jgi:predicted ArsR family transcriptional regulator
MRVLDEAREPTSATAIAERLGLPRQRVNYHVQALAKAGFLQRAGTRRKRNLVEQRWRASARSFVLAPTVLGPLAADPRRITDPLSAAHLLALGAQMCSELAESMAQAREADKRLSTLSINTAFHFESAEQRAEFARALRDAVTDVVARFTSPAGPDAPGRPFRLAVGCYPTPKETDDET